MLTLKKVAAAVDASANTIKAWIDAGKFPAPVYLPNGDKRWLEVDVIRWQMALQTVAPENPVKTNPDAHRASPSVTERQSPKPPKNPE
jgi:predicted DNA-binding transcriptional regulator AlpA